MGLVQIISLFTPAQSDDAMRTHSAKPSGLNDHPTPVEEWSVLWSFPVIRASPSNPSAPTHNTMKTGSKLPPVRTTFCDTSGWKSHHRYQLVKARWDCNRSQQYLFHLFLWQNLKWQGKNPANCDGMMQSWHGQSNKKPAAHRHNDECQYQCRELEMGWKRQLRQQIGYKSTSLLQAQYHWHNRSHQHSCMGMMSPSTPVNGNSAWCSCSVPTNREAACHDAPATDTQYFHTKSILSWNNLGRVRVPALVEVWL